MEKEVAVVGIPRCGTTWLFRSLMNLGPGSGTPKGAAYKNLSGLKMHSLAPPETFGDPHAYDLRYHTHTHRKTIWVFGDPISAVVSTRLKRWDHVHAANCGCFETLNEVNIFSRDCFNYELMFDSWMKAHEYPVLVMRYETMWHNRAIVEAFLDRSVAWSPWSLRDPTNNFSRIKPEQLELVRKTYSRLSEKIAKAPDVAVF